MIYLKNDRLEVSIAELGGEVRAVKLDGEDMMWSGDEKFWTGVSPILFPICGGLRDDKYTLNGKEYSLEKHGFARRSEFVLEKRGCNFVTMLLKDNEETLKKFPFHFELRVTYSVRGATLKVDFDVKNLSPDLMYFSIGSHEAYACPGGIEDYDIIFPKKETLGAYMLNGTLLDRGTDTVIMESNVLPLYTKYFETDALIFKDVKSREATLRNRKTGRNVTVEFPGCDYLLIWTIPGADYVCIEPWCGIPSFYDEGYAIEEKEGIQSLEPNGVFHRTHTIHF